MGENIGWHYGFGAAGIGMVFGLIQFIFTKKYLGDVGLYPSIKITGDQKKRDQIIITIFLASIFIISVSGIFGLWSFDPLPIANLMTLIITLISIGYFAYLFIFGNLDTLERKKITLIMILFIGAAFFWSGFDQAEVLLTFLQKSIRVDLLVAKYPASWLQILNPALVVILSPLCLILDFSWKKMLDPKLPFKFGIGLLMARF